MTRPLPRFLILGFLLFIGDLWLGAQADASRPVAPPGTAIADDELLFREALLRGYHETDSIVRMRLARNMRFASGEDERTDARLVEEAIGLDMHETDLVVRRRLVQKLTLQIQARGRRVEPTEEELEAHLDANRDRWHRPARITAIQLYFRDAERAEAQRAQLPAAPSPDDTAMRRLADPLPIPHHLPRHAKRELAKLLGPEFAEAVMALDPGSWEGPLPSAYGEHWVFVQERSEAAAVPLSAVRTEVRESLLAERGEAALDTWIADMRTRFDLPRPGAEKPS